MNEPPAAACHDLDAIVRAYPPDQRVTVAVAHADFAGPVGAGDPVVIAGRVERGAAVTKSGVVTGRVKRLLVEVEIDLATYQAGTNDNQASFDF